MKALIYQSIAQIIFSKSSLLDLKILSKSHNKKVNITGVLSYRDNVFYQYLEGEEIEINALMDKIKNDERHAVKKILYFSSLKERVFQCWYMKIYEPNLKRLNEDILIRNLFSFVGTKGTNSKYLESFFLQNLISINDQLS